MRRRHPGFHLALATVLGLTWLGWRQLSHRNPPAEANRVETARSRMVETKLPPQSFGGTGRDKLVQAAAPVTASPGTNGLIASGAAHRPTPSLKTGMNPEEAMDEILDSDLSANAKAMKLLDRYHDWPEELRLEAVHHLVNLLDDEHFALLHPILLNPDTPNAMLDPIMDDLLMRPDNLRLPLLVELAHREAHPLQEEALFFEDLYLPEE